MIRRRTAVLYCGPRGEVTDLNADLEFPPMTTPEQAIELMGYTLIEEPTSEGATE